MHSFKMFYLIFFIVITNLSGNFVVSKPLEDNETLKDSILNIPDDFLFGAGTSAFQTEGAWNTSGKTESFMEYVMHKLKLGNSSDFHVSSDSYHQYKQDVKMLKDAGLNVYRFSLSWPRLLPTGYTDNINEDGVLFYHALLDEINKNGIEPYVVLNHFDHPIILEKKFGGWTDKAMIEAFVEYAAFVFEEFGSKIRMYATFNEPNMLCFRMVSQDWLNSNNPLAPANLTTSYRCGHNILKAHSIVYHTYHERYNPTRNGMIGINLNCENYFSKHKDDHLSAEIAFQFACGWFAHPIFSKSGDYPKLMRELIDEKSKIEGLEESRLPTFSKKWIDYIKGAGDFFAFTHYESHLVEPIPKDNSSWNNILLPNDTGLATSEDPNWPRAPNGYYIVPHGLRSLLRKIKEEYSNPPIYLSENGYANDGKLDDIDRIKFLYTFIREVLNARKYDKCDIKAYFYWSLIDSYEYYMGYDAHFGLAHVDFNSPNRTRTLRRSATWLRNIIETRKPDINNISIN